MTGLPPEIRDLLACPRCRGALDDAGSSSAPLLRCPACGLAYPVEQGIPVLLAERALPSPALGST
jgi:uncharacterized protein YbaR (Trm112 family)